MDYTIRIDDFEGPLDLLLHLIKEANINICDISIDDITTQYMNYINAISTFDMEVTAEYLIMASELMFIKSKSLLPSYKDDCELEDEDVGFSKELLIDKLSKYQKYKELAEDFKKMELERGSIYTKVPSNLNGFVMEYNNFNKLGKDDLLNAFYFVLDRKDREKPINTKVTNKEYSVKKRKNDIKEYLKLNKRALFTDLFDKCSKDYIIVTFMSILELARDSVIDLSQEKNFSNIYIELKDV